MTRTAPACGLAFLVALAASAASARAAGLPFVSLSAAPAQVTLPARGAGTVTLVNRGSARVAVDVSTADFAFDVVGRARIGRAAASRRSARSWLRIAPHRPILGPGGAARIRIAARAPRGAEPGDHHALVLLTTRPVRRGPVALRTRIGVLVLVRVPGRIVRRIAVRGLRVQRLGRLRLLQIFVVNRGNVTERLLPRCVTVSLVRNGRTLTRLAAVPRDLLPRTRGRVLVRYAGRLRGRFRAVVRVRPLRAALDGPGAPELRPFALAFPIRL